MFGNRTFKEVTKVKWGYKGSAIIQYDCFTYTKRKRYKRCMQRKGHVRTQLENGDLQAKEKSQEKSNSLGP